MVEGFTRFAGEDLVLARGRAGFSEAIVPGEILGLAGLDGHGQESFLKVLAGLQAPHAGIVTLERKSQWQRITRFRQAVDAGIVYLPRDRRSTGIFPTLSVIDNFAIATPGRDLRGGLISAERRRARYEAYRARLSIVAPDADAPITTLSGGNQQKVLLARALALNPRVLLLNDPTRGVDIATRRTLYGVFRDLARDGMALVILSSEIEEVLLLSDRLLVFRDHSLAARLTGATMRSDAVIAAMFGLAA
ncbi:MAG TPA: ATP-binding cassette domain-containing protein [Acidisoma sp.]|uniref:ATP-binding cassette domain-containing protein n=1 Tax=Acidisoma sp. TaxID=1872115 RepID=UPI002BE6DC27|nr:ATP-binding cassette domain-containing protein [Acidisoma sp.]HTI00927.1 ATP-binding cassette domain-containing protein [Acidisoma sp.]